MSIIKANPVLEKILTAELPALAQAEDLPEEDIRARIDEGTMVLLANPAHANVRATLIGQPASIKVNANIGTSPFMDHPDMEAKKLKVAEQAGAHAVMDLSTSGDLDEIRTMMLASSPLPLGTVPVYAVAQKMVAAGKDPADFTPDDILDEIQNQAEQGVDFMTVHCGVTMRGAGFAVRDRVLGIVSRGGSILARWMREHTRENPFLTHYDEILAIAREFNVTLSLGDGLRPGAGADAGDMAQWEEVIMLGELALRAREEGVQVMIEGPGHVPLNLVESQIRGIKRATCGAPLYVLGPLVTDSAPGYDHIAGAVGGTLAGMHGADFLCYLTPAEHLTLPSCEDVRTGVKASLVAAHAAEVALGRPRAVKRDLEISKARMELDWETIGKLAIDPRAGRGAPQGAPRGKGMRNVRKVLRNPHALRVADR